MRRKRYGSYRRSVGPDFGRLTKKRRDGRLVGLVIVLLCSVCLGVGAYVLTDHNLSKNNTFADITPTGTPSGPTPIAKPTASPVEQRSTAELSAAYYGTYPDGFLSDFVDTRERKTIRGIYVNTSYLGLAKYPSLDELIELVDTTEINAMVIDIKDDYGYVLYDSKVPKVSEVQSKNIKIKDLKAFVAQLKEHDIYCIARIVAMKDMVATKNDVSMAIKNQDGTRYIDPEGVSWLNPYSKEAWEYLTAISKEVVEAGFDEINFDYLRTSSANSLANADFGTVPEGMTRADAIISFVKYACAELKPMGAFVSGDVFATIINSTSDGDRIGQSYVELSKYLDYICPMAYPSHYANGYAGFKYPDKEPFALMLTEMKSSVKRLSVIPEGQYRAEVRPWLQDFTATWLNSGQYIVYGGKEVRQQISAAYTAGYQGWFLWNAGMWFSEDGLLRDKD